MNAVVDKLINNEEIKLMVVIIMRYDRLDFRHCDDRKEAAEQQEQGHEQTKAADQHHRVDRRWIEISPAGG